MVSAYPHDHSEQTIYLQYVNTLKKILCVLCDNRQMIVLTDIYHKLTDKLHIGPQKYLSIIVYKN